jgi:hypothetical protein
MISSLSNTRTYLLFFLSILLITSSINSSSGQAKSDFTVITNGLELVNENLVITYDIEDFKSKDRFKVWIEVESSSGEIIDAQALSGDIGVNVVGGPGKQILWNLNQDEIILDDDISVEVVAEIILARTDVGMGQAVLLSTVYPGWGLSKVSRRKPYLILGALGFGTIAGSVYYKISSDANYDDYLASTIKIERDGFYDDYEQQNQMAMIMGISAGSIWGINLIWTAIKAKKASTLYSAVNDKKSGFKFSTAYNYELKAPVLSLKYNF